MEINQDARLNNCVNNEELRQEKIKQARRNFPEWKHYQIISVAPFYLDSEDKRREIIILNLVGRLNDFLKTKKGKFINYFTILSFSSSDALTKEEFIYAHKRGDGQYVYQGQFYSPVEMMKMTNEICLEGCMDIFIEEDEWNMKD